MRRCLAAWPGAVHFLQDVADAVDLRSHANLAIVAVVGPWKHHQAEVDLVPFVGDHARYCRAHDVPLAGAVVANQTIAHRA